MAMYYQSNSEIESADNSLRTLYLMNPNYISSSDQSQPQPQHNIFFLNPAASFAPHAPPPFVGIPLPHDPSRPPPAPAHQQDIDIPAVAQSAMAARHHYSTWGLVDHGDQPPPPPRGLSLSLSAHRRSGFDRPPISGDRDFQAGQPSAGVISPKPCSTPSPSLTTTTTTESNGVGTMQSVIMGSRYLKIAQELLDEVVNVGNQPPQKADAVKGPTAANTEAQANSKGGAAAADLTTAQRQEIQMKKAKLSRMLDEVEQRCRQYHHQMQMIVAAFEQAAGTGSARSYTQLALKTMMKQFRCLKSTISAQIKGLSKSLGEEEDLFEGSRLRFIDHHRLHLRQQQQQQQLGMMQNNNAWRPHRGLPERAVSVLRAWLFQHFLHPYPKDSDKQILAKQTGLTKSQVSNWFINARVRLWKPMVEEMYLEETKKQSNTTDDASIKPEPAAEISPPAASLPARTNFAQLITSLNMENNNLNPEKNPKKPRNAVVLSPDAADQRFGTENYLSMAAANVNRYGIGELDQQLQAAGFGGGQGNGSFSLSLALPPTEGFLSHRSFEFGTTRMDESEGGGRNINEIVDFQNRKPFPPQLLPDFVT